MSDQGKEGKEGEGGMERKGKETEGKTVYHFL